VENFNFQIVWGDAQTLLISSGILTASALAGILAYLLLYKFFTRIKRNGTSTLQLLVAKQTRPPVRYILPLLGLTVVLPLTSLPERFKSGLEHFLTICLISSVGWLMITLVQVISTLVTTRYSTVGTDDLHARRILTQTQVLQRIVIGCIIVVTVGIVLMTFPSARQIGTSVFASAGIAGVIVGMAARSTFASLIAGLQVAITQPIRIDDAVVVEGEWGWIEEIESTYVVVRLWDLRRLIVPLTYFIEKPFQNWTRSTSEIIGTVFIHVDYSLPVEPVRVELQRILRETKLWNGKTGVLQVTEFTESTMQLRCLMSANSSSIAFDLRCHVRERLIKFLQENFPRSLPTRRDAVTLHPAAPDNSNVERNVQPPS
jgi:small-conductance mechanosensitive channel